MHIERIVYPHLGIIDEVEVKDEEDEEKTEEESDKKETL